MIDHKHSIAWAETTLRFLDAFDAGDVDTLARLWEQAETNPQMEQMLGELMDGLALEESLDPDWKTASQGVRELLRTHLPSAFPFTTELPQLTVGAVAAQLKTDSGLYARFNAADRAANERLLADTTPIPQELGLSHFDKWRTTLGASASPSYWRAFRHAAVLKAMGRCQQAGELAAARRAGRDPRRGQ